MDASGRVNILVVDDDVDMCNLIKQYLSGIAAIKGVFVAPSATIGVTKMQNVGIDLVISDYKLASGKNGLQFLNTLIQSNSNAKYLLISGNLSSEDLAQAYTVVGQNILAKPFSREKLLQKIGAILDRPLIKA